MKAVGVTDKISDYETKSMKNLSVKEKLWRNPFGEIA